MSERSFLRLALPVLLVVAAGIALRVTLVFVPSAHNDVLGFREWGRAAADAGATRVWSASSCNYMPL